ncbi:MAG: universal stress protein [Desulfobacteraceae bacterium]
MLPVGKIVYPTDFSDPSLEALKIANELALHFSALLCVVHVIPSVPVFSPAPIPPSPPTVPQFDVHLYQQELREHSSKALEDFIEAHIPSEVTVKTIIATGNAADQIVRVAETENCDLIVIATHGRTGWSRFLLGSVAERVVRNAPCPVLSIQAPPEAASNL